MSQRLRVLISAYACRPEEGSEPSIGWETVRHVVPHHDVWVLTRANNRPGLNQALSEHPLPGLNIVDFDLPIGLRWIKRGQRGVQLHYYLWQIVAYWKARQLHQHHHFDVVHHVTYVKYWSPSFLTLLPIPFVWGPVGGGEECPVSFRKTFSRSGQIYERLRDFARWLAERDPFVALTARRSELARATTAETAERLTMLGAKTVEVYSQVGLSSDQLTELASYSSLNSSRVRFISVGRLLHWKGFHLGLQAFAIAQSKLPSGAEYWIIGDGAEQQRLQSLAQDLGIQDRVHFRGKLPRQDIFRELGSCVALIHPSLHESGGMVCVEAMAAMCPVICLNTGGPAVQVTSETGIKVSAQTPQQTIQELADAMVALAIDPSRRAQMGQSAQTHVQNHYAWDIKGKEFAELYRQMMKKMDQKTSVKIPAESSQ